MKTADLSEAPLDVLLKEFSTSAAGAGRALDQSHAKLNRRYARHAFAVADELSRRGQPDKLALRALLSDANPWIRSWAAVELVTLAPTEAITVMRRLASEESGLVGFGAQEFLRARGVSP